MIREFGLELTENRFNFDRFYFTGEQFIAVEQLRRDQQIHFEDLQSRLNVLAKKSKNMREVLDEILQEKNPLYRVLAVSLAAYEGGDIESLSPLYTQTLYHMLLGGLAAAHQSCEEENHIDFSSIKRGNAQLPEKMAEALGPRVHLGHPLTKVAASSTGGFILMFQGGQKVEADLLVLAIPCPVYEEIVFEENIIALEKLEAIKNVRYGTNAKILVPFSKMPSKNEGFADDLVVSFFNSECNCLNLYYTGQLSYFSEKTIEERYSRERSMMEKGFGEVCPPFTSPVCAKDEAYISYEGPVGHSWPNDPYAKGSYSYIAAGQESLLTALENNEKEVFKTLFAPINKKLYFAGEHTSVLMDVPGTLEAACESGERIARAILSTHFLCDEEI